MSTCRSCGATIRWERTVADKPMPLDVDPTADGNIAITHIGGKQVALVLGREDAVTSQAAGHVLYKSHFATCPNAPEHRKPKT